MKYAITGAAGNVSKSLVKQLLAAGETVTVIGRNKTHLQELIRLGATAAIGSVDDVEFLKTAFAGADAVYTMYPPNFTTHDLKGCFEQVAKKYAEAIRVNEIEYIVNLSSVGAHLPQGVGPISGLHRAENVLNTLLDVNIKHLRPCYFYSNLMSYIDMIKNIGIMGSNFSISENGFPVVSPADIAAVAAEELLSLNFEGHSIRYVASDETGTDKIAETLGMAIGKPGLTWIRFSDEQVFQGMMQAGMSKEVAADHVEMFKALNSQKVFEDYRKHRPDQLGITKLEDFAKVFAEAYNATEVFA